MKYVIAFLVLLASIAVAQGATCATGTAGAAPVATLTFTAPTTNTDGTPIATPLTYILLQGTTSGGEVQAASGITGSPVTINTGLADSTTYYFEVEVVDAHGTKSAPSNEVCKAFPAGVPGTITITIT
jgi:beta-galactosidase